MFSTLRLGGEGGTEQNTQNVIEFLLAKYFPSTVAQKLHVWKIRWGSMLVNIDTVGRGDALKRRVKIICPGYGPPLGKVLFFTGGV